MSYETHKKLILFFLCFYFVAGMYVVDKYPFFNWALFTKIPNEQSDFTIEITAFDGTAYDPPLPFSESRFIFEAIGQSPTQYTQPISDLGRALERTDDEAVARDRTAVEKMFDGKSFSYNLVRISYDPVELWRTGSYKEEVQVASYDSNHAP